MKSNFQPLGHLKDLLAAAEKRKIASIRERLKIPSDLLIEGLQLESLAYHLSERSGKVQLELKAGILYVGEPGSPGRIPYHGDAVAFLLSKWGVNKSEAETGCTIEVKLGIRL